MRLMFLSILCFLFSPSIYAEQVLTSLRSLNNSFRLPEQCLLGSWQSDKEKTLEYNLPVWEWAAKYHKIKHKQQYYDLFGKMIVTYDSGIADIDFNENGLISSKMKNPYKIIQTGRNFLVIQLNEKDDLTGQKYYTFFFENPNSYYVQMLHRHLLNETSTSREYFRRITPTPKACVMP